VFRYDGRVTSRLCATCRTGEQHGAGARCGIRARSEHTWIRHRRTMIPRKAEIPGRDSGEFFLKEFVHKLWIGLAVSSFHDLSDKITQ